MSNEAEGTLTLTVPSPTKAKEPVRFFGTYSAKVATSTSQVTLPKLFKKTVEEGDEGILMLVPNDPNDAPYWQLYTKKALNELIEHTRTNTELKENNEGKKLARELAETAIPVEYDTQGRFVLSKDFTAKLGCEKNEVVFVAAHTHLRLWAESDYVREQEQIKAEKQSAKYKAARRAMLD